MRIAKVILLASLVAVLVMRPSAARAQALTQPGQTVTLAWSASPDGSVTGYKVYYGEVANSQTNQLDVGQVLTASVPNLQPGVTYFFFATAYDASRIESVPSNLITYTPVVSPQADLAILSVSASPAVPLEGSSVVFSAVITNLGGADLAAGQNVPVSFSIDGGAAVSTTLLTNSLPAGGTTTVTGAANPWLAVSGNHTLAATVDSNGSVSESNETNNQWQTTLAVTARQPDLIVTALNYSPSASLLEGNQVSFSATVANQGNGALASGQSVQIRFAIDGGVAISTASLTDSLPAGGSATVAVPSPSAWIAVAGDHTLTATVDATGLVNESNEANNQAQVTITVAARQADLAITAVSYSPLTPLESNAVTFGVVITNRGNGDLAAGQNVQVSFSIDGGAAVATATLTNSLAAGGTTTVLTTNAWLAVAGTHTLTATVDSDDSVSESNEANNQFQAPLAVTARQPDLIVTSVNYFPSASLLEGNYVIFSATIANQGTGALTVGQPVQVSFALDGAPASGWATLTNSLSPGESAIVTVAPPTNGGFSTYWQAVAGIHTLQATADPTGLINESNEANNQAQATLTVAPRQPDLVITGVSFTPLAPVAGNSVTFSAVITNQGRAALASGLNVQVSFSIDGAPASSWAVLTNSLAAGGAATVTCTAAMAWPAVAGTHTVVASVDTTGLVGESSETNNQFATVVSVAAAPVLKPDLAVTAISFWPAAPVEGDCVYVTAMITNQGQAALAAGQVARISLSVDGTAIGLWGSLSGSLQTGAVVSVWAAMSTNGTPYWRAVAGAHTITAMVDSDGQISEGNESNNLRQVTLSVALPPPPAISLTLDRTSIGESDTNGAVVTLRASRVCSLPVNVTLAIGGTARNGIDYAPVASAVVIPAGTNCACFRLFPISDRLVGTTKTVTFNLLSEGEYQLSSAGNPATLAIFNQDVDSDHDGMSDAIELIAGTDPNDGNSSLKITAVQAEPDGRLTLGWASVPGVTYRIMTRATLTDANWSPASPAIMATGNTINWTISPTNSAGFFGLSVETDAPGL